MRRPKGSNAGIDINNFEHINWITSTVCANKSPLGQPRHAMRIGEYRDFIGKAAHDTES
jgi:hypothetical protein